jgi:hypothetical protein
MRVEWRDILVQLLAFRRVSVLWNAERKANLLLKKIKS